MDTFFKQYPSMSIVHTKNNIMTALIKKYILTYTIFFPIRMLLITNVVPLLLGTFAETCSLNLPQKGRKAGHDCLWAVA